MCDRHIVRPSKLWSIGIAVYIGTVCKDKNHKTRTLLAWNFAREHIFFYFGFRNLLEETDAICSRVC